MGPGGSSLVWVRVPELVPEESYIWLWWRQPVAVQPAYTTDGSTWNDGYLGVYHLCHDSDFLRDSSVWSNDLTAKGGATAVADGVIAGAGKLTANKSDWLVAADNGMLDGMDALTLQLWLYDTKNDTQARGLIAKRNGSNAGDRSYGLFKHTGRKLFFDVGSERATFDNAITDKERWYQVMVVYDSSLPSGRTKLYLDGVLVDSNDQATGSVPLKEAPLTNVGFAHNPHPAPLPEGEGENNLFFIGFVGL